MTAGRAANAREDARKHERVVTHPTPILRFIDARVDVCRTGDISLVRAGCGAIPTDDPSTDIETLEPNSSLPPRRTANQCKELPKLPGNPSRTAGQLTTDKRSHGRSFHPPRRLTDPPRRDSAGRNRAAGAQRRGGASRTDPSSSAPKRRIRELAGQPGQLGERGALWPMLGCRNSGLFGAERRFRNPLTDGQTVERFR